MYFIEYRKILIINFTIKYWKIFNVARITVHIRLYDYRSHITTA
jgi:hypothetical protein